MLCVWQVLKRHIMGGGMKSGTLIAFATMAAWLGMGSLVWGGDEATLKQGNSDSSTPPVANELLMFFEEKDMETATKRTTSLRRAPAIATIITADEIRNMGARNLLDILKMVPGFGISLNEYGSPMVEVRGIRTPLNEKILLMIDGHSLNKNFTGSGLFAEAEVPVENIRQVEVVRGPGSALYGSNAFVATINIITRDAEEIDGLELKAGGGSFDTYKGNMVGGTTIGDKFNVVASLDHYRTIGPKLRVGADLLSTTPGLAPFSAAPGTTDQGFRQTDAFLKVGYGDLTFKGHVVLKQMGSYIGYNYTLTDGSHNDIDNYWGELAYHLQVNDAIASTTKLRYDYLNQDGWIKIAPAGFLGTFPDGAIGIPLVKNRTLGVEQQFDWDLFSNNHLIAGASYEALRQYDTGTLQNYSFTPPSPLPNYLGSLQSGPNWNRDVTRETWAAYVQDEWQLFEDLNLTAGLRYDHYNDFGGTTNPRVGLVWNFLGNADLKLLYGQAFRAPNFIELYSVSNPLLLGNANLKPERIRTYEAGLTYRFNRFIAADLNYFYSTINDQIVTVSSSPQTAFYTNLGKTETQGVEFGLNGGFAGNVNWKTTYVFQDPRDATTDSRLPYVPSHRGTASINYAPFKYLNLHSDLLWTGPRPRPAGDSRPEVPDYTTVDLAVTLKNFFETLEIQAVVRNLFDKRFSDPDTSGALQKVPGDFPREGISAFVTASCKF